VQCTRLRSMVQCTRLRSMVQCTRLRSMVQCTRLRSMVQCIRLRSMVHPRLDSRAHGSGLHTRYRAVHINSGLHTQLRAPYEVCVSCQVPADQRFRATLQQLYYFIAAPTLVFSVAYPRCAV
jgi:hypothetical protein